MIVADATGQPVENASAIGECPGQKMAQYGRNADIGIIDGLLSAVLRRADRSHCLRAAPGFGATFTIAARFLNPAKRSRTPLPAGIAIPKRSFEPAPPRGGGPVAKVKTALAGPGPRV